MSTLPSLSIQTGKSNTREYKVSFLNALDAHDKEIFSAKGVYVLMDHKVSQLYEVLLRPLIQGPCMLIEATEDEKSWSGVGRVLEWLQKNKARRQSTLIAIGGGIIQDIATFASHLYYRGISWIFYPTTLLSMSDSCIGAKCGINLGPYKNQLGVFHSPSEVRIFDGFIETLTDADIASGYGEILKLALTGSESHLVWIEKTVNKGGLRNSELLSLVRSSLEVKKSVIEKDEFEYDLRRILNYGHTFGHALEAVTEHEVPHGHAVSWGLDFINFMAVKRGWLTQTVFERVHGFIANNLPLKIKKRVSTQALLEASTRDKKVGLDGRVSLAVLKGYGKLEIIPTLLDSTLEAQLKEYLDKHDVFHR